MKFLSLVTAALLFPLIVHAQETGATNDDAARSFYDAGLASFDNGQFEAALSAFEQGYALSERPQFLFNMASSLDRLHRTEEARDTYQRYADSGVETDEARRSFVQQRIEVLTEEFERDAAMEADRAEAERLEREALTAEREPPSRSYAAPIVAFGVAGAGLITFAVAGGLTIGRHSSSKTDCEAGRCNEDDLATLERGALIADIGLGVAAAGAVVGVVLLLVGGGDDDASESANLHIAPSFSRNGGGISAVGSF